MRIATRQIDGDGDVALLHHRRASRFNVTGCTAAFFSHQHIAQPHAHLLHIQIHHACIADGAQDAAQIGVAGEESGFHQRRTCNRIGHLARFFGSGGVPHIYGDEFGGTLAIAHNRLRQFQGQVHQHRFNRFVSRTRSRCHRRQFRFACRHNHKTVVGRGIAVHADAVKGFVGHLFHQHLQHLGGNVGIHGDEAQHGRHVRMYHARAFGYAGKAHMLTVYHQFTTARFGYRVCGHDGFGGHIPMHRLHFLDGGLDFFIWQRLQNHAG